MTAYRHTAWRVHAADAGLVIVRYLKFGPRSAQQFGLKGGKQHEGYPVGGRCRLWRGSAGASNSPGVASAVENGTRAEGHRVQGGPLSNHRSVFDAATRGEPDTSENAIHRRRWLSTRSQFWWRWLWSFFFFGPMNGKTSADANAGNGERRQTAVAIPVVAAQAATGNIGVYLTGLGAITPIFTVTIRSRVDGQLMSVHFKEGDLVNQGDALIEIDPRPYEAVVEQAQGQLVRDQALLANARVDVSRYQTLLADNAVPEQQLATQLALVTQYEGTVTNDQGILDAAKLNVVYCHIASPITGIVGLRLVDPGNIVHAADANGMVVVAQIQPISVIFTLAEINCPRFSRRYRPGRNSPWTPGIAT